MNNNGLTTITWEIIYIQGSTAVSIHDIAFPVLPLVGSKLVAATPEKLFDGVVTRVDMAIDHITYKNNRIVIELRDHHDN